MYSGFDIIQVYAPTLANVPPHTTITSAVDGNNSPIQNGGTTSFNSTKFTFTATSGTNPISGFQCSLDNTPFFNCNSPATFNNLAPGPHKFTVAAVEGRNFRYRH